MIALSIPSTHRRPRPGPRRRETSLGGAREDHAAENDDDDAEPSAATDVFLQEDAGDDRCGDQFEVQEQRHGPRRCAVEREDEQDRGETTTECDGDHQP